MVLLINSTGKEIGYEEGPSTAMATHLRKERVLVTSPEMAYMVNVITHHLCELLKYPQEKRDVVPVGPVLAVGESASVHMVDCKDSHIGPKIVASHVTVQLPEGWRGTGGRRWILICLLLACLLLALGLGLGLGLPHSAPPAEDAIYDGGHHPSDWYYIRQDRNLSECEQPDRTPRKALLVDSVSGACDTPDTCLQLINSFGKTWVDFYLVGGRVYEGLGWNCANSSSLELRLVFITQGMSPVSQLDMYSFNSLITAGIPNEISKAYQVFPACCLDHGTKKPARGVLIFIETLPTFEDRSCITKPGNCI